MVYVVLGMHKSGTTLISRILHESGVNMGCFNQNISYDEGNQYEREETNLLNKEILGCGNNISIDVVNAAQKVDVFKNEELSSKISKTLGEINKTNLDWGFKDPRTCLTFSVWENYITNYKIIFIYRDPSEIFSHYTKLTSRGNFIKKITLGRKSLRAWYIYNKNAYEIVNEHQNESYVTSYYDFMNKENILEMEKFVGIKLFDFRNKKMYRSKSKKSLLFNICVYYEKLITKRDIVGLYESLLSYNNTISS